MNKKSIIIIGPIPPPSGGVPTFTRFILNSRLNFIFNFIHLDITRTRGLKGSGEINLINFLSFLRQFLNLFKLLIENNVFAVHIPMTSNLSFWKESTFLLISKLFGSKTIIHLHGGGFIDFYINSSHATRKFIKFVFRSTSLIIALSNAWKTKIDTFLTNNNKILVLPNSIDQNFYINIKNSKIFDRERNKIKRILFIGHLLERKGIFDILNAVPLVLKTNENVLFSFAGPEGKSNIINEIFEISKRNHTIGNIDICGEVHGQKKYELFLSSNIFVLPSYVENFSISILEAMAFGLPIITTKVGANTEILENYENCLFVKKNDPVQLANHINILLNNQKLRLTMGENNIIAFNKFFSPNIIIDKLEGIYTSLSI